MTSWFVSSLIVRDDFGLPFELVEPLVYSSELLGYTVTVPAGFKTDLASIPPGFWNLMPKSGRYDRAAVVHDWLYVNNHVTRAEADGALKEAMQVLGVPSWKLNVIYWGCRAGGFKSWNRYRAAEKVSS